MAAKAIVLIVELKMQKSSLICNFSFCTYVSKIQAKKKGKKEMTGAAHIEGLDKLKCKSSDSDSSSKSNDSDSDAKSNDSGLKSGSKSKSSMVILLFNPSTLYIMLIR